MRWNPWPSATPGTVSASSAAMPAANTRRLPSMFFIVSLSSKRRWNSGGGHDATRTRSSRGRVESRSRSRDPLRRPRKERAMPNSKNLTKVGERAHPLIHQTAREIQAFGHIARLPIALSESAAAKSIANLNQVLADTMTLRDLYKKHHWQVAGPTFHQLHLLYDKHFEEQVEIVDTVAERIQMLG